MNLFNLSYNIKENTKFDNTKFVLEITKWLYKIRAKVPENLIKYNITFQSSYPYYNLVDEFENFLQKKKYDKHILYILTLIADPQQNGKYLFYGEFDEKLSEDYENNIVGIIYKKNKTKK